MIRAQLERDGSGLEMPWRYGLDLARLEWLRDRVDDFGQLAPLQTRLREERLVRAWRTLDTAFLASVERHEVQHRWDFDHPHRQGAAAAFARAGVPRARGPDARALEDRAFDELSAYLAQLATAPLPRATLAPLASALLEDPGWITAEARAAAVLLPAPKHQHPGEMPPARLVERGAVRPDAVAALLRALLARPSAELAPAARTVWEHLQQRPLPALAPP